MKTLELWQLTQNALCNKEWSKARTLLEDLGKRTDNTDLLLSARAYGCPEHLIGVIQDRIDLVNSKVE